MDDQVYHPERAEQLVALLRALAARIDALSDDAALLAAGPELLKMMGDARSELFHYEVRATYDTPEVAESRRIVEQARRQAAALDFDGPVDQEDEPWRGG
jgi:predicted DNA-binding transcriptional regulator YafY